MIETLQDFYKQDKVNKLTDAIDVKSGGYYCVLVDGMYCRVRVLEVFEKNVNCFLIDYGDEHLVLKDAIYQLDTQFSKQQAQVTAQNSLLNWLAISFCIQAFICRLSGLEELYEVSTSSEHLHGLENTVVFMETDSKNLGECYLLWLGFSVFVLLCSDAFQQHIIHTILYQSSCISKMKQFLLISNLYPS